MSNTKKPVFAEKVQSLYEVDYPTNMPIFTYDTINFFICCSSDSEVTLFANYVETFFKIFAQNSQLFGCYRARLFFHVCRYAEFI